MTSWTPTVGERAYVVTRHNTQWIEARPVLVTAVLKTKIKTDGGDFSLNKKMVRRVRAVRSRPRSRSEDVIPDGTRLGDCG